MSAPAPSVALVDVPQELIEAEPSLQGGFGDAAFQPGVCHGSLLLTEVSGDREGFLHTAVAENRMRFAKLAVLYGWLQADDHQFLYENQPPHLVWSHDHGHFFPGGQNWTEETLNASHSAAIPDQKVVSSCALMDTEVHVALREIRDLSTPEQVIAEVISAIPTDWPFSPAERIAMARFLEARRLALVSLIP